MSEPPGTSDYFDKICGDYINAEITSLVLHNRSTGKWCTLLTLIELIPVEQEPSPLIGNADTSYMQRQTVDSTYSVYISRMIKCTVKEAISVFNSPEKGFTLQHEHVLNFPVQLFDESQLEQEPPSDFPLLVSSHSDTPGNILPQRRTAVRVWSKIDRAKKWLDHLEEKQRVKLFEKAAVLTIKHLGFDFSRLKEHAGNIYLFCCNPFLRRFDCVLLDMNRDLLIHFAERDQKTIIGKKLVLEDKRAGTLGFNMEKTISGIHERIQLPHFPDLLYTKIYDSNGFLIENHVGKWINFEFQMQMQTAELNLTVKEGAKKKTKVIPKFASEKPVRVGEYNHSLTYYLKDQQRGKEVEDLQKSKEFIFFSGSKDDKERAREVVGELLNRASKLCMMLDPYFGAGDLYYAYIIRNISVPIKIITSAAFLKSKIATSGGRRIANATYLKKAFARYKKTFPHQPIECKVLLGGKSPLHDRYIITDNRVYLLGSSFNEFGTRATTLIKVPAPEIMIDQAIRWWDDKSKTLSLDDFIKTLKTGK